MRKLFITIMAAVLLMGSTLDVSAAGLRDVFSAKYYADQYADLKAAFGYDEEMLYQHFLTYGLKEGRNMSPILDVREYREKYADLDVAFGDNWDAYVQHFFDYGINENRDNGTNFDVKTYIKAYSDIEAAFGNDFEAVVEHYLTFGMKENRTKGDPVVYQQSLKAEQNSGNDSEGGAEIDDVVNIYDENGRLIKVLYKFNGRVDCYDVYEYDDDNNGLLMTITQYNASDVVVYVRTFEYEDGVLKTETGRYADGTVTYVYEYNAAGIRVKSTEYNGINIRVSEFDDEGKLVKAVTTLTDGTMVHMEEYVLNAQGERIRRTSWYMNDGSCTVSIYNADNVQIGQERYDAAGNLTEILEIEYLDNGYSKFYWKHGDGVLKSISIHDEKGRDIENATYDAEGNIVGRAYHKYNESGFVIWGKEVEQDGRYRIWENDDNGKIQKCTYYSANDEIENYVLYSYNDKNQCIRDEMYNKYDELQGYTVYTYDENGNRVSDEYFSANTRDNSYELVYADGLTCSLGCDSSVVDIYRNDGDDKAQFHPADEEADAPFGDVAIKTGCNSYEEYKEDLLDRISTERGVAKDQIWVSEYENCTVNGYTYYALQWGYRTENDIDNQDVIYVKIGDNVYVEVDNLWFTGYLKDLVQNVIYINSVN